MMMRRKILIAVVVATFGLAGVLLALSPGEAAVVSPGVAGALKSSLSPSAETPMFVQRRGGGYRGYSRDYAYRGCGYG
jgi:hypothetical protein